MGVSSREGMLGERFPFAKLNVNQTFSDRYFPEKISVAFLQRMKNAFSLWVKKKRRVVC